MAYREFSTTLTLTSNAIDATTDPGPASPALNLSTTMSEVKVDLYEVKTLVLTGATNHQIIFEGADLDEADEGVDGSWIYMKNVTAGDTDIYIGIEPDGDVAVDLAGDGNAQRLFTLKQSEFCFFPFDHTMSITVDGEGAATLEYWRFNRQLEG